MPARSGFPRATARAVVALAGGLLAGACGSGHLSPYRAQLEGSWRWVESSGGVAGRTLTPGSEGYGVTFRFLAEHRLSVLRDGQVRVSTGYRLEDSTARGQPGAVLVRYGLPVDVFRFDPDLAAQRIARLTADTLRLADPCCDRYEHLFLRAR